VEFLRNGAKLDGSDSSRDIIQGIVRGLAGIYPSSPQSNHRVGNSLHPPGLQNPIAFTSTFLANVLEKPPMTVPRLLQCSSGAILFLFLAACETSRNGPGSPLPALRVPPGAQAPPPKKHYDNESFWVGDGMSGSPSIKIVIHEQKAYFYKGGKLAGVSVLSTGREGHPTDLGHFSVQEKDEDHKSSLYGNYVDAGGTVVQPDVDVTKDPKPAGAHFEGSPMRHFMRINGGTGMHEGFLPGYPDSHGCIRMPGWMAENFYNNVSVGTPVTVVP